MKQSTSQEVEERNYVDGKLNGKATVLYPDTSKEIRTYKVQLHNNDLRQQYFSQDNKLTGPASLFAASGERIEFEYQDGVVHGPAKIKVVIDDTENDDNHDMFQGGGDIEECIYVNGVKHGKAVYHWKAGHKEEFLYEKGVKNGPALLFGASGATRKGQLKGGKWHGEATYTTQDGEVKKELWDNGQRV